MYHVNSQQFQGPMDKLLELIENKKMEVTQLNLSFVTNDFLAYLENLKKNSTECSPEEMRIISEFIVIASKLLLIKSKSLLPSLELTQEEETDLADFEKRLRFYAQFKPAMESIKILHQKNQKSFSRPLFLGKPAIFYPAKNISLKILEEKISLLFEDIKRTTLEFKKIEESLINLEEKVQEIISKISSGIKNFGHLIKEKPKKEIVVMFLALLHLLREQEIEIEQCNHFGEINIKKISGI